MPGKACLLTACILLAIITHAQKKTIVALGSSTTWGTGAVPIDSSWVNLTKAYYDNLGLLQQMINLGGYGATTYAAMPSDFTPPPGRPQPVIGYNVTAALSYNPDIIIINYPSNDLASGFPIAETMSNLRTIYKTVVDAGKICYITTTQPRTSLAPSLQPLSKDERDSIINAFGHYALNFYNPIVAADSLNINPIYNYDGTHVNNGGHQQLFQSVKSANVIPFAPLAVTLSAFTAVLQQQQVLLKWKPDEHAGKEAFIIQRSIDDISFEDLRRIDHLSDTTINALSWTDTHPSPGKSYYRIKISSTGEADFYSNTVAITYDFAGSKIGRLYPASSAHWNVEILSTRRARLTLRIVDAAGRQVLAMPVVTNPPSQVTSVTLPNLAKGQYFIQLASPQGSVDVRAFQKP